MAESKKERGFTRDTTGFKRDVAGFKRGTGFSREPFPTNPLDELEYTGDPEADSKQELALTLEALENKERQKALRDKIRLTTDSEYWCCFAFETRAQKEALLAALGLLDIGDKYIDGTELAQRLGIALPVSNIDYRATSKSNKRINDFIRD